MYQCKICNKEFEKLVSLSLHIKSHKISLEDYYLKFISNKKGICETCGKETVFLNIKDGYKKHCSISCSNKNRKLALNRSKTGRKNLKFKRENINKNRSLLYDLETTSNIIKNKFIEFTNKQSFNIAVNNLEFYLLKNNDLYNEVLFHTNYLDNDSKFSERIYCILNKLYNKPLCKHCNKKYTKFINGSLGYRDYCSVKCASNSKEKKLKIEKTNFEKYGFKNAFGHVKTYSKISQELFNSIYDKLDNKFKSHVFYGTLNKEYLIYKDIECNKNIRPDFTLVKDNLKIVIEFYGDIWHANPDIFKQNDRPNYSKSNLTSKDIWERDKNRIDIINKEGFKTLIIWEKDYHENKEKVITKCLNFIKNESSCY